MFSSAEMQTRTKTTPSLPSESCRRHPWHSRDVPRQIPTAFSFGYWRYSAETHVECVCAS